MMEGSYTTCVSGCAIIRSLEVHDPLERLEGSPHFNVVEVC
jgi:hypothetical protein